MAKNFLQKLTATLICTGMLLFGLPTSVLATEISNITGNNGVYNIEASKISGETGFREYEKFNLSQGDIANLIYKLNGSDFKNFVNLVDNQVVINGIINTMKDNNFYNGHAIFVSPNGIVIGNSGILNVGSLTLMAPSENAYNLFKKTYGDNLKDFEFNLKNDNYKSLITNSSGDIIINGKVFARDDVNAYGRRILTNVNPDDVTKSANANPAIFAGVQGYDKQITADSAAEALFNSLVSNDTTNADNIELKDGKIALVTNKVNEEILTTAIEKIESNNNTGNNTNPTTTNSDNGKENTKTTTTTTIINTVTGLKTVKTKAPNPDSTSDKDKDKTTTTYSIDKTYEKSSLSENSSEVKIDNTTLAAGEISIEANDSSEKEISDDTIKAYNDALKAAQNNNNDGKKDDTTQDKTTSNLIHKSFKDVAPAAKATVTITNSKLIADAITIEANAKSSTETSLQLLDTIYEKWIGTFGADVVMAVMMKINEKELPEGTPAYEWQVWKAIKSYFSDDTYDFFDGAKAVSNINITNTDIMAADSVDIISNAEAKLDISTATMDSSSAFMYGLGTSTESKVNIKDSKISTSADDGEVNINALSNLTEKLKYDGTKFLSLFTEKKSDSGNASDSGDGSNTGEKPNSGSDGEGGSSTGEKPNSGSDGEGGSTGEKPNSGSDNNQNADSGDKSDSNDKNPDTNSDTGKGKTKLLASAQDNAGSGSDTNKDDSGKDSGSDKDKTGGGSDGKTDTGSEGKTDTGSEGNKDKDKDNGGSEDKNKISAYNLVLLNNTVKDDTNVVIDNSTIETTNLNVRAIGYNETDVSLKNVSNVGKESEHTGVAAAMLINHFRSNTKIDVKNNTKITLKEKDPKMKTVTKDDGTKEEVVDKTYGDAKFITQNVNNISNSVESEVKAKEQTNKNTKTDITDNEKGILTKAYGWLNDKLFTKLGDKVSNVADKLQTQFSGSGIWNDEISTSVATIDNSTINSTTVDVSSNLVDLTINQAIANAGANNKIGAGAAVVVDDQHNTSNAKITNNAKITAKDEVNVNATTQMPMNPFELKIGQEVAGSDGNKTELFLGVGFDQGDGVANWDAEFLHTELKKLLNPDTLKSVGSALKKPKEFAGNNELSMDGLFNNFVKAQGSAETAAIAGSILVNTLKNDTVAEVVNGAVINVTGKEGNVNINAANSIVNYNAAGKVDFLIEEINKLISEKIGGNDPDKDEASKFGLGGSVLVSNLESNATAKIDNAKVKVDSGDINVNAGQEEAYVNALVTGGKAATFVIEGSVNVQNVGGKTAAYIINTDDISADSVNVNAGKGTIEMKQKGDDDPFEFDEDTHELNVKEPRKFDNTTIIVNILGVNATQKGSGSGSQSSSSGASVGASVNVATLKQEIEAYIDNSTITADEVNVNADTASKKIDVLLAAASAGGYDMKESKEEGKKSNEAKAEENKPQEGDKTSTDNKDKDKNKDQQTTDNNKKSKNIGNWMDMLDEAGDDEEDVMNLNNLFDENNASEQAQTSVKKNSETIKTTDKTVDKDGKEAAPKIEEGGDPEKGTSNKGAITEDAKKEKSNADKLTDNKNKTLEGDSNKKADTTTASSNFSLAAAGSVDITKDETKATAKITNSTINAGKKAEVSSSYDAFVVDVNGGFAKAGNVAVGAGVNVYRNYSATKSIVENSIINFTSADAQGLNVLSNADIGLYDVTVGIGAASNDEKGLKIAAGGSFGWNTLKNTVSSKINKSTVQKENDATNPNVTVEAKDNSKIWNVTGGVAFSKGGQGSTGIGGGIAATVNYSSKDIIAEVIDSNLKDVGDVKINADLTQDYNTIAIAAAIATGSQSSYNFDGAVNTEVNTNKVTARGKDSTIVSDGDVSITATENVTNKSLAGGLDLSTSQSGVGVGIGAIVNVDKPTITAESDNLKVEKSNSIDIKAKEIEDLKFLAVNLGIQTGGGHTINVNGIANVFISEIVAQTINNSVLNSTGNVGINSIYDNTLQGITAVAGGSMNGNAIGANLLANVYNNHVTAELQKGSKIKTDGDTSVNARASEDVVLTPVGLTLSNGGSAVAANINANVFVDTIKAQLYGEVEKSGNVLVNASDITSLITRGGTLKLSNGGSAIGGSVNVDVLDKTVTAEIKDTTVKSSGDVDVFANSINSFGGTKKDDGTYDVATIDDAKKITDKDKSGNVKDFETNNDFKNWNMFYDLSASFQASVSGAIVVKVIDNEVNSTVNNSTINAGNLNIRANDYSVANAIIGRLSYGGTASVGANVFVLAGSSDVNSKILSGSKINVGKDTVIAADSTKKSTLISVGGGASGTASVNGSAVANVINDTITAKIDDGVNIETGKLKVNSSSDNDLKGLIVNASFAGTAAIGAVVYINKQKSETYAQIGTDGQSGATIKAEDDITVKSQADDEFSALLVNIGGTGTAAIGATGLLNFVDSTAKSGIYNSNVTSEQGKVDVIADRGFNRQEKTSVNPFRSWFKDTSVYKTSGKPNSNGTTDTESKGLDKPDIEKLAPKVGVFSVGASGTVAVNASVISNDMEGHITSEVKNSTVSTEEGLNVLAKQDFTNFDAMAAVAGAGNVAINVSGIINVLEDTITAEVNNTKVTKGGVDVDAKSVMEVNQVVISGQGAGVGAAVGASVDVNKINDNVYAYVKNGSEIHGGTNVNAEHAIEINNILLGGSIGGTGFAGNFIPVINTYTGTTIAQVINSNVNDGDISITANDYVDNFSAVAGLSGMGAGASMNGFLIRNDYENTVEASLKDINIDTNNNINISSSSVVDSENALMSAAITGMGAGVSINIIINLIDSTVKSYIEDTVITKAGDITLTANKDKKDHIHNLTGNVGVAGVGASASTNLIYNLYENTILSYVEKTDIQKASNLTVEAHGYKLFEANNYGVTFAGVGGGVLVDAVANQIESETRAYVLANYKDKDGNAKDINVDNEINVTADDTIVATSDMGFAAAAGLGAGAGVNVNVSNYNEVVSAEILTDADNKVKAKNANIASKVVYALKNSMSGLAMGMGGIAGDVSVINLGKRDVVNSKEREDSKINEALSNVQLQYNRATTTEDKTVEKPAGDGRFNATTSSKDKTGAIARVNGNLETTEDIKLDSKTVLQGVGEKGKLTDTLTFDNLSIIMAGSAAGVGVKLVDFSNSTDAEIAGGNVKAGGNINLNAESVNDVKITNKEYSASGFSLGGAVGIYDNKALTNAKITNADVNAENVNINAKSSNKADVSSEAFTVSGAKVNVSVSKVIDKNVTNAIVTGDTNITADNLNLHATGNSDVASSLQSTVVSGANIAVIDSRVDETSVTNAIIKDVNGEINVSGLNLVASSDKLVASTSTNTTSVSGLKIGVTGSGANMNATMRAGIDSIKTQDDKKGLTINNSGKTIILSGVKVSDEQMKNIADLIENKAIGSATAEANAYIENKVISLFNGNVVNAKAINNVISNAIMKSDNHNADSLKMLAKIDEQANAELSSLSTAAINIGVSNLVTEVTGTVGVDVAGVNTIAKAVDIEVDSNVESSHSLESASYGIASGSGLGMTADVKSNTTLNIGGELNADTVDITTNTNRLSTIDYSSSAGGGISVTRISVDNKVNGESVINLDNYTPSKDYANKLTISHNSENTQDTVSSSVSGGALSISTASVGGELDSKTSLNIKNSDINLDNDIDISVNNTNIVKDTASMTNGGVIAIVSNDVNHTYGSGTAITVDNSKISAKNLIMKAISKVKNARENDWVDYRGASYGFIAGNDTKLTNTINQTSEIEFKNGAEVNADENVNLTVNTDANFMQKIDSSGAGFVAVPKSTNKLITNNTNRVAIDETSSVSAKRSTVFDFDSNNTLHTRSYADAKNFAGKPVAKSYLTLNVNNKLENKGKINAGSVVDINFMDNSNNDLNQYAHTDADAAVATSDQDGSLTRTYKNLISVAKNALISSKKDIDINYGSGKETLNSEISYRSTSYGLFGIPITVRGHWNKISGGPSHKLVLDGEMKAGEGNNRYMKITSDGKIDLTSLTGFGKGDYFLSEDVTGDSSDIKNNTIKILQARISEINKQIEELDKTIAKKEEAIDMIDKAIENIEAMENELNNPKYTQLSLEEFEKAGNEDYKALVKKALSDNNAGSVDYETITTEYIAYVKEMRNEIEKANDRFHTDGIEPSVKESDIMNIAKFIDSKKDGDTTNVYKNLTEQQIKILSDNADIVAKRLTETEKGKYNVYNDKYILVPSFTVPDATSATGTKEMTEAEALSTIKTLFADRLAIMKNDKANDESEKNLLVKNSKTQAENLLAIVFSKIDTIGDIPYFVELADIATEASGIYINGNISDTNDITGSGTFKVDSPALTVDNYSTRSVIVNSVMFGDGTHNGLIINGKGYSDYMNDDNKVIGTNDGVHYKSIGIGGNGDVKITNYYDILNPFAGTLDVPHNLQESDITMQRPILTSGKLDIFNDSGDIIALSDIEAGSKHLVSTRGNIQIMPDNKFTFKKNDSMFAGKNIRITGKEADMEEGGTIQAGYRERKLVITDEMLKPKNLVLDPTTGETNMINLGATPYLGDANGNNIKAIYKDGQIYVFGIDHTIGTVDMDIQSGSVASNIITKSGGNPITIKNDTNKVVNISKIFNPVSHGDFYMAGEADYSNRQHKPINLSNSAGAINIDSNGGINFNSYITNESGNINITNKNGDITIYDEIMTYMDDIIVSQNNGNVINGMSDKVLDKHYSVNFADYDKWEKIYIPNFVTGGNLVLNVIDGDIGVNSNPNAKIGIDATTRDYTDSLNVGVIGTIIATAKNNTKTDKRLINLRGHCSNLNLKEVTSDGDVILTAADWNTPDLRPTPKNDEEYFTGYSILNASENGSPINGQNVSLISSNTIGSADKKMVINQDTLTNNGAKVSIEGENNVYVDLKTNSNNPLHIDSIISKRGDIDLTNATNSIINYITSGGDLHILETGKELTIYNIGGNAIGFDDILYPHDNIGNGTNAAVPQSIEIEVLDALGGDNADSTLKIYSAYVQGRNKGQGEFDANGKQIADVSLMADNIYINSANAKDSSVTTKKNSNGFKQTNKTYTDTQLGLVGDTIYQAQGINAYGEGKAIVLDVKGVSKEFIDENTTAANRTNYNVQTPVAPDPMFANPDNQIVGHDYRTKNTVISVNNNSSTNRGAVFNAIYADDAYVDSKGTDLSVKDGYIKDYAEFSNIDKKITVDNNYRRRLRDADAQIYTEKTGSFSLGLDRSIDMKTTAPIVGNDFYELANDYQSEGNFVNRSRKDTANLNDNVDRHSKFDKQNYKEELKRTSVRFDTTKDADLKSNVKIYDLSTTGASIKNIDGLKVGDETKVRIAFDDVDVTLKSKVVSIQGDRAGVEFIDITPDVANKILYRYMQKQNTMKISKK